MISPESSRVVIVGPAHPYRGGIAHFSGQLTRSLESKGFAVNLVTFSRQYPAWLFPGESQVAEEDTADEQAFAYRWIDTLNPVSWWNTADKIAQLQPDAVLFQHWMPFFAPAYGTIARLLTRSGIPPYSVVHNALPHERHFGDEWLNRYFFSSCRGFIALSQAVKSDLLALDSSVNVSVASHPLYDRFGTAPDRTAARNALHLPDDAKVLLFFGYVRPYKGLKTLIEALPHVRERHPNVKLVVAGDFYEEAEDYTSRITELGLGDSVQLVPQYIPDEQVPVYFSAANVVVQPYLSATQSGVAHIAFHFGRPVIATKVGAIPELIEDGKNGLLVPPGDAVALSEAVIRYFDEDLEEHLAGGVQERARTAGSEELADELEKLLRDH